MLWSVACGGQDYLLITACRPECKCKWKYIHADIHADIDIINQS